jgi:hypothetical protein
VVLLLLLYMCLIPFYLLALTLYLALGLLSLHVNKYEFD